MKKKKRQVLHAFFIFRNWKKKRHESRRETIRDWGEEEGVEKVDMIKA
jgi:hypothetical protein